MRYIAYVLFVLLLTTGCSGDSSSASGDMSGDMGIDRVPFDGSVTAAPDAVVIDRRSFYPVFESAQWRYRRKTDDWQSPPSVTDGAESIVTLGPDDGEYLRRTTVFVDLMVDDSLQVVRQTIDELFVLEPSVMRAGPVLKVKGITIDERLAETDALVRRTERTYFPAYTFLPDAWRTGTIFPRVEESIHLTEVVTEPDLDEPRETRGMVSLLVTTDPVAQVLPMEGQYREGVHAVEVSDHFSGTITRRYWFQQGVGPVQWQFQLSGNTTYTLMASNVEGDGDAEP